MPEPLNQPELDLLRVIVRDMDKKIAAHGWDHPFGAKRCPTCGSPDPNYSHEECADGFHA